MEIQNTLDCFVLLWRMLERTRRLLQGQCKRFCIRNVLKAWFDCEANDNFIFPSLYPLKHRELLRAIVAVKLGIGMRKVGLRELDQAYSIAFPRSTAINKNKKKKNIKSIGK